MKPLWTWVIVLLLIAAAAGGGYWFGHRSGAPDKDESQSEGGGESKVEPVANVSVTKLRRGTIAADVRAYGTVIAPPSEVRAVSVPFESRVTNVLVAPGQVVSAGQPLVEVEGSAATRLMVQEAQNAQSAAERDLQSVKQRYEQKLATNADLNTAENNLKTAQGRLQNLQQSGADNPAPLKAGAAGVVSKVDVQIGQIVPMGNPLIEVAAQNNIEVQLGVEPEDAGALKTGQDASLQPVGEGSGKPVPGKIRLIGQRVDPTTRLVDVMVSIPPDSGLPLETFVAGTIARSVADALVVPRDAVLPNEEGGYELFTVKDGKAVKHAVRLGLENDQLSQVIGEDLKEGDLVVTVGNYELEDGMAVQVQEAATQPAETQPAHGGAEARS